MQRHGVGPVSLTALRRELAAVRAAGYAQEDGSVTPGFASVAVAVLDHAGHPAASVALTFPAAEVDAAARAELAARGGRPRRSPSGSAGANNGSCREGSGSAPLA